MVTLCSLTRYLANLSGVLSEDQTYYEVRLCKRIFMSGILEIRTRIDISPIVRSGNFGKGDKERGKEGL